MSIRCGNTKIGKHSHETIAEVRLCYQAGDGPAFYTTYKPATPVRRSLREEFAVIAPGYYATPSRTGNNDLDFWWVQRLDAGRWAGMTFVKRIIGGHPPEHLSFKAGVAVLFALAEMTEEERAEAQKTFADNLGRCFICGRTLTDEESRARGTGPVCAAL